MRNLIQEYRANAIAHGDGTMSGDRKKTNKAYGQLVKIFHEIITDKADYGLFDLYDDDNLSVQCWAATHTLEIDENRAKAKLNALSEGAFGPISLTAEYVLKGWELNQLKFR